MEVFVMVFKRLIRAGEEKEGAKTVHLLRTAILICLIATFGATACQQGVEEMVVTEEEGAAIKEGLIEFEGTVKVVQGKYVYIPETQGFDIVVLGPLTTGDLTSLVDKDVKGVGEFSLDRPSILIAQSLEMKDESGALTNVFTLTEEVVLDDYLDPHEREQFQILEGLAYNKAEDWEGLETGKVRGKLEETEGAYKIVLFDENERETGRIIVDEMTDFSRYYIQKLGLFDRFWFYLTIKETVDWNTRRRTRELFHADVVFAGLF